eukprot:1879079-Rhodomonas_salina.2
MEPYGSLGYCVGFPYPWKQRYADRPTSGIPIPISSGALLQVVQVRRKVQTVTTPKKCHHDVRERYKEQIWWFAPPYPGTLSSHRDDYDTAGA